MSYSAPYLDDSGIHLPTYNDRLQKLIEDYKSIFGEDVYVGQDTMDYQLLSIVAKCWDDLNSVILDVYNARNPNYASGSALDLLLPMNGVMRNPATRSSVVLTLLGNKNSTLPAGMQAMDEDNRIWEIGEEVKFDADGNATATAWCTEAGAVSAEVGAIHVINTPQANWYGVNNNVAATLGRNVETDAALRKRRSASVSLPSRSIISGMKAALLNLDGVIDANVVENDGNIQNPNNAEGLSDHSMCAVVRGGSDSDIARVLWLKKSPGCAMVGSSYGIYVDEYGHENRMLFRRPEERPVTVRIALATFAQFDDVLLNEQIPQAVAEYINQHSIGQDLIVSMLNSVVYNANTAGYPIFSITSINAKYGMNQEQATPLKAAYYSYFTSPGRVTVTHHSSTEHEILIN